MKPSGLNVKLVAGAIMLASPAMAQATSVNDPAGDFLSAYTGARGGDLDILSAGATFDGAGFRLSSLVNGTIGGTPNSLHVFGIDRGSGTARFNMGITPVGAGTLFDAVVVLFPGEIVRVVNFQPAGPPIITELANGAMLAGDRLELVAPAALLPSTGFAPGDYRFSMWTRQRVDIAVDSGNFEIADFAPEAGGFVATAVPEPATWATMLMGFFFLGGALRFRRPRHRPA